LEQRASGFYLNTNVQITLDDGDKAENYKVERDAATFIPKPGFRDGKEDDENPDDPGHVARQDQTIFVYDGPGIEAELKGRPAPAQMLGSGDYVSFYEIRVVDKKAGSYDPKRFYYGITITYKDGKAVGFETRVLTEEQYRTYVKAPKKENPK
jgi:hypothetical protein